MPQIPVPQGGAARSVHVQQIINWLRGLSAFSEPMSLTGLTSTSYALTVANAGTGGNALRIRNSTQSIDLLLIRDAGITVKPHSASQDIFTVRNFADTADLFKVSTSGVSIGSETVVTETSVSNLTNKTLTGALLANNRVTDYLDITHPSASAPSNPSANRSRIYGVTGDRYLRYRDSSGVESTLADIENAQTFLNKTLTTPSLGGPLFTTYAEFAVQVSDPSAPPTDRIRIYTHHSDVHFKDDDDLVWTFATLEKSETLTNKTITTPTISTPIITSGMQLNQSSAMGTPSAGQVFIYSVTSEGVLKAKFGNATERTFVDTDSVQTLSNKTISVTALSGVTLNQPIISNYANFAWASNPGGTTDTTRVWAANDNNVYGTLPGGTTFTFLTSLNTGAISTLSLARPLMLGVL